MELVLSHKPFDRVESQLASVAFFSDQFPLRQAAGLVDWRLNGRISHLIENERLQGTLGDSLIMPTQGRLHADIILFFGLGPRSCWRSSQAESQFAIWIDKLKRLKRDSWLLSFGGLTSDFLEWRQYIRIFIHHVASRPDIACRRLTLAEPASWVLETKKREMDFGGLVKVSYDLAAA